MHDHIHTVVGRYKGRIQSWDVVNEALNEDGTMRPSLWEKIIGDDYIAKAFQYAHEADPQAQLTYNDYNLENEAKRKGAIALITKLKAEGVPITSVGLQGHDSLTWPTVDQMDAAISDFARLGVKVAISELDIDVLPSATRQQTADVTVSIQQNAALNPYVNGLPDSIQQQLAKRYGELFGVFVKHRDVVTRVTFWGVTDGDSWRNDWPVRGRTSYPLLFDRTGQPKSAFEPSSALQVSLLRSTASEVDLDHRFQCRFPGSERDPKEARSLAFDRTEFAGRLAAVGNSLEAMAFTSGTRLSSRCSVWAKMACAKPHHVVTPEQVMW